jgi:hypothetical protein
VFYYKNQPVAEIVGFKGFPQGSVLSPFSYSFYTSQADRILPVRCSMLRYADDVVVYASNVTWKIPADDEVCLHAPAFMNFSGTLDCRYLSQSLCDIKWSMHACCVRISVPRCGV